ncbi:MAG: hypothetical protein U0793_17465 [Gemmataceae bacterium]
MAIKHTKPETLVGPETDTIEVAPLVPERPEPPEIVAAEPYAAMPAMPAMPAPSIPLMDVGATLDEIAFADANDLASVCELLAPPGGTETMAVAAEETVGFVEEVIGPTPRLWDRGLGIAPPKAGFDTALEETLGEFDSSLAMGEAGLTAARAKMMAAMPGAACLYPYEIEEYARTGRLSEPRQRHVESCAACAGVLAVQRRLHQEDEVSDAHWELLAALAGQRRGDASGLRTSRF